MPNTKNQIKPHLIDQGRAIKAGREHLGYKRDTLGRMLGYGGIHVKNVMMKVEQGRKSMPEDKRDKLCLWLAIGPPEDAPEPDLRLARYEHRVKKTGGLSHADIKREANQPRVLVLNRPK